ncbi:hypothetical protein VCHA53O466_50034 [Vibrio chagasii]|nr:hypothetical protein VCHA53O466_50034 [Vibrio chagasii]
MDICIEDGITTLTGRGTDCFTVTFSQHFINGCLIIEDLSDPMEAYTPIEESMHHVINHVRSVLVEGGLPKHIGFIDSLGLAGRIVCDYDEFSSFESICPTYNSLKLSPYDMAVLLQKPSLLKSKSEYYVVEWFDGCWLTDGDGDPSRTLVESSAQRYFTKKGAQLKLDDVSESNPHRDFSNALIKKVA